MMAPSMSTKIFPAGTFAKGFRIAAGLACATLLTACLGSSQTSEAYISAFYSRGVVAYVTQGGAMPLEVKGQPFAGMDGDDIAWHTAQRMKLPAWFATRDFAPAPVPGTPSGNYRTVLIFNSSELTTDSDDACGDSAKIKLNPPGDTVYIIAAFCAGDEVVTDSYGSAVAAGPDASEYRQLLFQISVALFPYQNILNDASPDIPPNS
jgi:hypothetical protein